MTGAPIQFMVCQTVKQMHQRWQRVFSPVRIGRVALHAAHRQMNIH